MLVQLPNLPVSFSDAPLEVLPPLHCQPLVLYLQLLHLSLQSDSVTLQLDSTGDTRGEVLTSVQCDTRVTNISAV